MLFALTPLVVSICFRTLAHELSLEELSKSTEILFSSIMLSAVALADLCNSKRELAPSLLSKLFKSALIGGLAIGVLLYGALLHDTIPGPGSAEFRSGVLLVSIWIAVALFLVGTVVQILIGRIEI